MSFRQLSRFAAGALIVLGGVSLAIATTDADAARAGSGGNAGRQSSNVTAQHPPATPGVTQKSATPAAAAPAAGAAAAAAAKPAGSRWLGPLAGIAAGLGIGALLSHFGMGGAMGDFLMILLIGVAVFFAITFLLRMFRGSSAPAALQGAGSSAPQMPQPVMRESAQPVAVTRQVPSEFGSGSVQEQDPSWFVPSDFDANQFLQQAKQQFVAIQKVWDSGDVQQLRNFLTDDLLVELQGQLAGRAGVNQTDVVLLNAELLGIEKVTDGHLASVRFSGMLREQPGTEAFRFEEVWNLFKPAQGGWLLAGIQQIPVTHAS